MTTSGPVTILRRVVIGAPGSGHGKTMIATGIMAALRAQGLAVSPHKVGPDYIDPSYHALASGRPGRNLDPYLQGEERVVPLLLHGAATPEPADISVIEGVMGLFDGAIGSRGFASTAHVASLTSSPVVLVVDCAATARSVGAVVHGFSRFDEDVRVAGVILNNVGSPRHEREAREGVASTGVPVLGVVPRLPEVVVPSRHLGLIPVAERHPEATTAVEALADLVARHVDLEALRAVADQAPPVHAQPWDPATELGGAPARDRPRVALAAGPAFSFGYAEVPELLCAAGAEVVTFDPLRDEGLPPGTAAVLIPGGFPEVHAPALSANTRLRQSISAFATNGGIVAGECAGLLYLGESLDGHPMCGVLPVEASMGRRLTLGYRTAVALVDSALAVEGQRVTGHEFHRTQVTAGSGATAEAGLGPAWAWQGDDGPVREGLAGPTVHASYLHVHWAGYPQLARRLVEAASNVVPGRAESHATGHASPRGLVLGVGGRARSDAEALAALARTALENAGQAGTPVTVVSTIGRRADDPAVRELAARLGAEVAAYPAETLAAQPVPHPSKTVARHCGTPSVAEAAVLAAGAQLLAPRTTDHHWTVAVGRLDATPRSAPDRQESTA